MKGTLYAGFMERRGRKIFEAAGCYWYEVNQRMIMSIPYHEPMDPAPSEVIELVRRTRSVGARYLAPEGDGLVGGLYLRRKAPYEVTTVHRKARNRLRHALEKCSVREVEKSELQARGLQLNLDTMTRQGRFDAEFGEPAQWNRLVEAIYSSRGVKVFGAFAEGLLAAYAITLTEERWLHILHTFSASEFLSDYFPNEALTFELTRCAAEDPRVDSVSYGVAGLVNGAGLHEYKLRHGYEFVPYGYAFLLHPAARLALANPLSTWGIRSARRLWPSMQTIERIASVVEGARATSTRHGRPTLTQELDLG